MAPAADTWSSRRRSPLLRLLIYPSHLCETGLLHGLQHQVTDLSGRGGDLGAGLFQSLDLGGSGSLASRDDGTGVTHPPARRSGGTGDERDDGLGVRSGLVELFEIGGGLFLHGSTDLSDQDDSLGLGVLEEDLDDVDVLRSVGPGRAWQVSESLRMQLGRDEAYPGKGSPPIPTVKV